MFLKILQLVSFFILYIFISYTIFLVIYKFGYFAICFSFPLIMIALKMTSLLEKFWNWYLRKN